MFQRHEVLLKRLCEMLLKPFVVTVGAFADTLKAFPVPVEVFPGKPDAVDNCLECRLLQFFQVVFRCSFRDHSPPASYSINRQNADQQAAWMESQNCTG